MTRARRGLLLAAMIPSSLASLVAIGACGTGDLLVGDDSRDDRATPSEGGDERDASARDADNSTDDGSGNDGAATACSAAPVGPGRCLPDASACRVADKALTCPAAGTYCCLQECPSIAQPPPGFCEAGSPAPTYDKNGCIAGFACTPVACATAGGTCVGLAPSACPAGHVGDATQYSCGPGIGVMCCLP